MKRFRAAVCGAAVLWLAAAGSLGDTIHMKDGRVFEGRIVSQTRTQVVIETTVSNIKTTLTLKMRDVKSIEEGPVDEGGAAEAPAAPERRETAAPKREEREDKPRESRSQSGRGEIAQYLVIPIEGTFGEEILPEGVEDSLQYAKRSGIEHIVFRINSGGGYVWAASEIAEAMMEHDADLTYHAVIQDAISASIWVALNCDTIHMLPGSSIGGAVVFSTDNSTGAAEVDAKMNSIIAANLASSAEARGHHPALVKAMILPEKAAYHWVDENGVSHLSDERPRDVKECRTLDAPGAVLTLTAEEAAMIGFAKPLKGDVEELGASLALEGWRKRSNYGEAAMRKAQRKRDVSGAGTMDLVARFNTVVEIINRTIEEAGAEDPGYVNIEYYADTGLLTPASQRRWQEQSDRAIQSWERVLEGLKELNRVQKDLEKAGLEPPIHSLDLRDIASRAQRKIQDLRANRNRRYR
ncbi:MAG: hypothetical protein VYC34_03875 [Planctomycetota bacterium]|nr:hypothetical protein [Planctomycetota bacterium]